jgi:tetratricopeptide (TPR) repeat protein
MAHLREDPNESLPRMDFPPGPAIPPRSNRRPSRRETIPPQPSLRHHTIRLAVATATGIVLMLVLLWLAIQYAQRDWNRKNTRARASHALKSAKATAGSATMANPLPGWKYALMPAATQRQLRRLSSDRVVSNWWTILGRSLSSDTPDPGLLVSCLYMAMAVGGENAEIKNDLGAIYLQQKRMKDAVAQFRAADQIQPGFAPARFNLALCAVSDRNPTRAVQLLGQYLGQRPEDSSALRLQSTLLSQLGRSREALRMLEKFLQNQPPEQPLFLETAWLAARLGQNGNAIRYLETAMNGNAIQTVIRVYQSPAFREIRLSGEGDKLAARMADKARAAFGTPVPPEEIQPLRAATPEAKIR